ncbi:unnamed protein product [Larinioides sclopetarius]|uniref:Fibrinogen C-terminal domain-containing protein n=1 Tax=Larinioides sclopetarius TaxID=280406 RepID=A0AAV2BWN2_9ARAC
MNIVLVFESFLLIFTDFCSAEATGTPKTPEVRGFCSECPKLKHPLDCSEIMKSGVTESGVYAIYPRSRVSGGKSIEVYCDMVTDGGGWTVIQRRGEYGNSEAYFVKNWNEYKEGFGDFKKEFWLGNDKIYSITNQGQYAVRFDMTHGNGTSAYTRYDNFWIENEAAKYTLRISEWSGTGGDSVSNHNGFAFYTIDQPNLPEGETGTRSGGWWKNGWRTSSLNGLNLYKTDKVDTLDGITWVTFGGLVKSLKTTEIKIRPKKFQ